MHKEIDGQMLIAAENASRDRWAKMPQIYSNEMLDGQKMLQIYSNEMLDGQKMLQIYSNEMLDGQKMLQIYSNKMLDVKKDRPNDETPFAKHRGGDHWVCPLSIITLKAVFGVSPLSIITLKAVFGVSPLSIITLKAVFGVSPLSIITLKAVFGAVLYPSNYLAAPPASTAPYW